MTLQNDFNDELLSGYLDGEVTAAEQQLVERALEENPELRHTFDELRALRGSLQSLPRYTLGRDFPQRVLRAVERQAAAAPLVAPGRLVRVRRWKVVFLTAGMVSAAALAVAAFMALPRADVPMNVAVSPVSPEITPPAVAPAPRPSVPPVKPIENAIAALPNVPEETQLPPGPGKVFRPTAEGEDRPAPAPRISVPNEELPPRVAPAPSPIHQLARAALATNDLLVMEIEATPLADRTLALVAALKGSHIAVTSPPRTAAVGEGEGSEGSTPVEKPAGNSAPPKVEYFMVEASPDQIELLVTLLRSRGTSFSRVDEPLKLADAISKLSALDPLASGQVVPEPRGVSSAASVAPSSIEVRVSPPATGPAPVAVPAVAPQEGPQTGSPAVARPSTPGARAYLVSSPADALFHSPPATKPGSKGVASATSAGLVRMLVVVQHASAK